MRTIRLLCIAALGLLSSMPAPARADIPLTDPERANGWEVTTSGRVNSYAVYIFGDTVNRNGFGNLAPNGIDRYILVGPQIGIIGNPLPSGAVGDPNNDTTLRTFRMRGGFANTVFNVNISKQLSPRVRFSVRIGLWGGIQNNTVSGVRNQNDVPTVDWREQYLKLEGPWGAVVAGRALGLFNRGGMRVNWYLMHQYGVGHPCTVDSGGTASCGHTGVGSLHPGRNAQLAYATPEAGGFQATAAVLDPSMIPGNLSTSPQWVRTPLPRFEGEATFRRGVKGGDELNLFVNGMEQVIGMSTEIPADPTNMLAGVPADAERIVWGYGVGGWGRFKALGLGATYWAGKGLGTGFSFSNTAVDNRGNLRTHFGYLGIANLRFGDFEIAGGYGSSNVEQTAFDANRPAAVDLFSVAKEVRGISGMMAYRYGPLTFSIDGMNIRTSWHKGEQQTTNVVSAGVLGEW